MKRSDMNGMGKTARGARGFTLMEILVTIAIIGILAAIAIPTYAAYIQRANRSDARAQLVEAAAFLQRAFSQNSAYPNALPAPYLQAPRTGTVKYTIAIANPGGANTYTLTATRAGSMVNDECGDFTLRQDGVRGLNFGATPSADNVLITRCWQR